MKPLTNEEIIEEVFGEFNEKRFGTGKIWFVHFVRKALTLKDRQQAEAVEELKKRLKVHERINPYIVKEIDKIFGDFSNQTRPTEQKLVVAERTQLPEGDKIHSQEGRRPTKFKPMHRRAAESGGSNPSIPDTQKSKGEKE